MAGGADGGATDDGPDDAPTDRAIDLPAVVGGDAGPVVGVVAERGALPLVQVAACIVAPEPDGTDTTTAAADVLAGAEPLGPIKSASPGTVTTSVPGSAAAGSATTAEAADDVAEAVLLTGTVQPVKPNSPSRTAAPRIRRPRIPPFLPDALRATGEARTPTGRADRFADIQNEGVSNMTVRLRAALDSLPAYAPGRNVPGAVKLASNEIPFPALPEVVDAISAAINGDTPAVGINRYPDNGAQTLTGRLAEHLGQPADRIAAGGGSVALCQQLAQITAGEGDEVLFNWRSFEAYPIVTQITGSVPVRVPLRPDHALDLDALAAAITPRTRLIFVCTPNNPTGTVVHQDELDRFLARVPDDVLVVIDEAYREFNTDPATPDGVVEAGQRGNVLALRTLSKAYGLAGLRCGYAVGAAEVVTALKKVAIPFALNSLAQSAAVVALGLRDQLEPRWRQIVTERDRVQGGLRSAGYQVPTSQANFVWLPLRERAADFAAHCEAARVIVRPFSDATGGVRITIGAPAENDALLAAARTWPGLGG